ncbi:uncharacterized protein MONOS_18348 [Monocercomonoides exilis]|uniref:uncharacterized protein n=1 Tax=Monocercomonoides exilis TaxID=2049356 RepID=UPI00355A81BC|nr:hypothetical protein MONOS_18348 [Monocercomonoides exilis]
MNQIIDEICGEDFISICTFDFFEELFEMIEEKKIHMGKAVLLLKRIGSCRTIYGIDVNVFFHPLLNDTFQEMIVEEKKKEEKNEKLLVDLCECCILLSEGRISNEIFEFCLPFILKVALRKEKSDETQKEVEMALLTLSEFHLFAGIGIEMFFDEITWIIKHHQKHGNLTRLAYQSAWKFLIRRLLFDEKLEYVVVNSLQFVKEVRRVLDELMGYVDWKRMNEKEVKKSEIYVKELIVIERWIQTLGIYFDCWEIFYEDCSILVCYIDQVFQAAKDNHREICYQCVRSFEKAAGCCCVEFEDLIKYGAVDAILEVIQRQTMDDRITYESFRFFMHISTALKKKWKSEIGETKRKDTKKKLLEKFEEEGYEDSFTKFYETFHFLNRKPIFRELSFDISDYFVKI